MKKLRVNVKVLQKDKLMKNNNIYSRSTSQQTEWKVDISKEYIGVLQTVCKELYYRGPVKENYNNGLFDFLQKKGYR